MDWATHKMKPRISISTQRHRDTEFLFFSVSLYLCVVFIYESGIIFDACIKVQNSDKESKMLIYLHFQV